MEMDGRTLEEVLVDGTPVLLRNDHAGRFGLAKVETLSKRNNKA